MVQSCHVGVCHFQLRNATKPSALLKRLSVSQMPHLMHRRQGMRRLREYDMSTSFIEACALLAEEYRRMTADSTQEYMELVETVSELLQCLARFYFRLRLTDRSMNRLILIDFQAAERNALRDSPLLVDFAWLPVRPAASEYHHFVADPRVIQSIRDEQPENR